MPRRILKGVVISDKCDKTITVKVERRVMHPAYKKYITRSKKYAAHDEANTAKAGDMVAIRESRPLSKTKRWELIEVVGVGNDISVSGVHENPLADLS